jgi:uncharacterized protein YbjT (DUF2867 family)
MTTALLVGASGLVGGHCLRFLLKEPRYTQVVSVGRRRLPLQHIKLAQHVIDFEQLPASAEWLTADAVFCCLGTTFSKAGSQEAFRRVDFGYPYELARIAASRGAEQFLLVSALGADTQSRWFYNRVKGETENAISQLPFRGVQIFRPSLLQGNRDEFRLAEWVGLTLARWFPWRLAGPLRRYQPVKAEAVAYAMVAVARENLAGVNVFEAEEIRSLFAGLE